MTSLLNIAAARLAVRRQARRSWCIFARDQRLQDALRLLDKHAKLRNGLGRRAVFIGVQDQRAFQLFELAEDLRELGDVIGVLGETPPLARAIRLDHLETACGRQGRSTSEISLGAAV